MGRGRVVGRDRGPTKVRGIATTRRWSEPDFGLLDSESRQMPGGCLNRSFAAMRTNDLPSALSSVVDRWKRCNAISPRPLERPPLEARVVPANCPFVCATRLSPFACPVRRKLVDS